jgi:hypothetical protein
VSKYLKTEVLLQLYSFFIRYLHASDKEVKGEFGSKDQIEIDEKPIMAILSVHVIFIARKG